MATSTFMHSSLLVSPLSSVGGGRGVFSNEDIRAGTLLIQEEPYDVPAPPISSELTLHRHITNHLLLTKDDKKFIDLHPQTLSDLSPSERKRADDQHVEYITSLNVQFPEHTKDYLLRLLLSIQFNAFSSGLYHLQSMINHHCNPNCTKSTPLRKTCSQIIACQDIKKGEEITIHYGAPIERSWRYRHDFLLEQHYFHVSPTPFIEHLDEELDEKQIKVVDNIERRLDDVRLTLNDAMKLLGIVKTCLPENHLVRVRASIIVVRLLLPLLEKTGEAKVAALALTLSLWILERRKEYLSVDHLDIADSEEDVEQLISFLLSNNQQLLFSQFPKQFGCFSTASKAEFLATKNKKRIRALYP